MHFIPQTAWICRAGEAWKGAAYSSSQAYIKRSDALAAHAANP